MLKRMKMWTRILLAVIYQEQIVHAQEQIMLQDAEVMNDEIHVNTYDAFGNVLSLGNSPEPNDVLIRGSYKLRLK